MMAGLHWPALLLLTVPGLVARILLVLDVALLIADGRSRRLRIGGHGALLARTRPQYWQAERCRRCAHAHKTDAVDTNNIVVRELCGTLNKPHQGKRTIAKST
ncbi:hypothetical protein [Massilia sp. BJB1822]|uniref:hypothetical protein n=1 Tax=Massilia sp. BJB1822 TaxID=2744470 RepID=UPI0035A63D42